MIATPAHAGVVTVQYAHALYHTGHEAAAVGINIVPVFMPGESLIQRARNDLVRIALSANVDDLLFIDADQEWEPRAVLEILAHNVDVVGAPVRKKTDYQESYNVRSLTPDIPVDLNTGLLIVDSVGTGFIRLSRKALQALWDASEPYSDGVFSNRMVFDIRIIDGALWSEDTLMCLKLGKAGFRIHVDPKLFVGHIGTKNFRGDFQNWLARVKARKAG